jgi:hypothetical protein
MAREASRYSPHLPTFDLAFGSGITISFFGEYANRRYRFNLIRIKFFRDFALFRCGRAA